MPSDRDSLLRLRKMLEAFVGGTDQSVRAANEIEGFLAESFPDDEGLDDLTAALASYRPFGGDFLYDRHSIRRVCADALAEIQSRLTELDNR